MTDPNNVPLPQMPAPNGTPAQQNPSTPQYGAPAPAPAQPDYGQFNAPAPAQPAYGQPAYGQPAPDSSAPGAAPGATPAYGQPAADPYAANAAPQFPAPGAAPTYGQPGPDANAYGQVPPAYNQYAAPTATAAVPLNKPYYDCPFPEAFLRFWKKYVVFKGRASRSEFWWWTLASVGISVLLSLLSSATDGKLGFLSSIWSLAILIPSLALAVRRLHDTDKPGWWVAIFYGAMALGMIIMVAGGGAALYGAFGSLSDSSYGAMATGGLGAMAIGGLITLAGSIVYIVFMAMPSKPEGARFDDDAVAPRCLRVLTAHRTALPQPRTSTRPLRAPLRTHPLLTSTSQPRPMVSRPHRLLTTASPLCLRPITVRYRFRSTASPTLRPHSTARFRRFPKTLMMGPPCCLRTRLPPMTTHRNPGKASD